MVNFEQPSATNEENKLFDITSLPRAKRWFCVKRLKTLLQIILTQIEFKGKKLTSCFKIKGIVNFERKHDLVCHGNGPANNYNNDHVGGTGRRISERIIDHNGIDLNCHLLKHHSEKEHKCLQNKDFVIRSSGFRNNTVKRMIP